MSSITRVCVICGERFSMSSVDEPDLYCSDDCWDAAQKKRQRILSVDEMIENDIDAAIEERHEREEI